MVWKTYELGDLASRGWSWLWVWGVGVVSWVKHGRDQLLHVSMGHALHSASRPMALFTARKGKVTAYQ